MPPDPKLVDDIARIRSWSNKPRQQTYTQTASINFVFDNGSTVLAAPMRILCKVGMACKIVGAQIIANTATANASFSLRFSTFLDYPIMTPVYTPTTIPTLVAASKIECDITGWLTNFQIQDVMECVLQTVSGSPTSIVFALQVKKYTQGQGWGTRTLSSDLLGVDTLVSSTGDAITIRENGDSSL